MDFLSQMTDFMLSQPKIEPQAKPTGTDPSTSSEERPDFESLLSQKKNDLASKDGKPAENQDGLNKGEKPVVDGPPASQEQDGLSSEEQMAMAAIAAAQLNIVVPVEEQAVAPVEQAVAAVVQTGGETPKGQSANGNSQLPQQEQAAPEQTVAVTEKAQPIQTQSAGEQPSAEQQQSSDEPAIPSAPRQTADTKTEQPQVEDAAEPIERPLFRELETTPVKVGDGVELDAPDTEESVKNQLMRSLTNAANNGESSVRISLQPESLGKVTVEMTRREDGTLNVLLHADNLRTQSILEKHAGSLQNLLVDRTDGSVQVQVERQQESQSGRQDLYDQESQQEQQGQQQHRPRKQQEENDFLQQLRLGLIPVDGEAS